MTVIAVTAIIASLQRVAIIVIVIVIGRVVMVSIAISIVVIFIVVVSVIYSHCYVTRVDGGRPPRRQYEPRPRGISRLIKQI